MVKPDKKLPTRVDPSFFDPFGLGSLPPEFYGWEDEDEPGLSEDYWDRFRQHVKQSPDCWRALQTLEDKGLAQRTVEAHLAGFALPQRTTSDHKRAAALGQRLARHRKDIDRFLKEVRKFQADARTRQLQRELGTPLALSALDQYAKTIKQFAAYHRRRTSLKGKSQRRNDAHLVWLSLVVRHATGEAHLGELACLAGAALEAQHHKHTEFEPDAVRQIVARFRKLHRRLYEFWDGVLRSAAKRGFAASVAFMPWLEPERENKEKLLSLAFAVNQATGPNIS